jgi:hypothetical protein
MPERPRFHLAFPARDLAEVRAGIGDPLLRPAGRSRDESFDFFGHQIVSHLSLNAAADKEHNAVDGDAVPLRHFDATLCLLSGKAPVAKQQGRNVSFIFEPEYRFDDDRS